MQKKKPYVLGALMVKGAYRRRGKEVGRSAKQGEFPFIVFIVSTLDFEIKCGGSLKKSDLVLTSGNCISSAKGEFMNLRYFAVVGGIVQYYDVNGEDRQVRKILEKRSIGGSEELYSKMNNIIYLVLKKPFSIDHSLSTARYGALNDDCDDCEVVAFSVSNSYIKRQLAEEYEEGYGAKGIKHFPLRVFKLNPSENCRYCGKTQASIKTIVCFPCNYCEAVEPGSVLLKNGTVVGHFLSSVKCFIKKQSSAVAVFYSYKSVMTFLSHTVTLAHHSSYLIYVLIPLLNFYL